MLGIEVQAAAEEVDGCLEVLSVPVAARPPFDGHDLAVESLGRAVGDPMPAKGQNVVQMPGEHLPDGPGNRQKNPFLRLLNFLAWSVPRRDDHGSVSNGT